MSAKKCSVCNQKMFYDEGVKWEDQKSGTLYCGAKACLPEDKTDLLQLNGLEARDAGILKAATRMRVPSSTPNRRAEHLEHHLKKE